MMNFQLCFKAKVNFNYKFSFYANEQYIPENRD